MLLHRNKHLTVHIALCIQLVYIQIIASKQSSTLIKSVNIYWNNVIFHKQC